VNFSHLNRRLHLYLGLFLLPWLFMYGVSSIPFAHSQYFQQRDEAKKMPLWTTRLQQPLELPVPDSPAALREFGRAVLQKAGVEAPNFGVNRPNPGTVNIYVFSFLRASRVVYSVDQKKVTVEDRRFRFDQFLTGFHARGGFEQDGLLQKSWGVLVDVVVVAMVLWIATGVYLWWGVPGHRRWGGLALISGAASFLVFTLCL
jgi:hypothetical protein